VTPPPAPALPGPAGVVVAVPAAGLCGSALPFSAGASPFPAPVALGPAAVGPLVAAGPPVRPVGVGALVL
ncbi:dehydrogenase, partial [Mycobacterium tuberculosis]